MLEGTLYLVLVLVQQYFGLTAVILALAGALQLVLPEQVLMQLRWDIAPLFWVVHTMQLCCFILVVEALF
jgi:hypothetical protein